MLDQTGIVAGLYELLALPPAFFSVALRIGTMIDGLKWTKVID